MPKCSSGREVSAAWSDGVTGEQGSDIAPLSLRHLLGEPGFRALVGGWTIDSCHHVSPHFSDSFEVAVARRSSRADG